MQDVSNSVKGISQQGWERGCLYNPGLLPTKRSAPNRKFTWALVSPGLCALISLSPHLFFWVGFFCSGSVQPLSVVDICDKPAFSLAGIDKCISYLARQLDACHMEGTAHSSGEAGEGTFLTRLQLLRFAPSSSIPTVEMETWPSGRHSSNNFRS